MKNTIHRLGCIIDASYDSADTLNEQTIAFAVSLGFDAGELLNEENEDGSENEDYSQLLSETADSAVDFLNEQDLPAYCSYFFEDNCLFLTPCIENAKEDVGFVSSKDQEYPEDDYEGEWLHVSDHGNCTLYVREAGKDQEIWSVV